MTGPGAASQGDPHGQEPVVTTGAALNEAAAAMILVHGRGDTPQGILSLAAALHEPRFAYLAPGAAGNTWYPHSFLAPVEQNEPGVSSAIARVGQVVDHVVAEGVDHAHIVLLGFSQGACVVLEYAARRARRYGGVIGLSGGLIGDDDTAREYAGSLAGTPVFLGCSDVDAHIPLDRVESTAQILSALDAEVTKRIYPGMGHYVNDDEIAFVRGLMAELIDGNAAGGQPTADEAK